MRTNIGNADKIIRIIISLLMGLISFMGIFSTTIGVILLVMAVFIILTSIFSFCPIYALIGISSCAKKED